MRHSNQIEDAAILEVSMQMKLLPNLLKNWTRTALFILEREIA